MDNETRQYGYPEPERERGDRPNRPKQYFPDTQQRERNAQRDSQRRYAEPAYEPAYADDYYGAEPRYADARYAEPRYADAPYVESTYAEPERGSNAGAIALGVIAAISFVAAVSLFFLWRGAAAEANKPPVTETVTQTTTQVETTTKTTTKFPSIFGERDNPTATLPPDEPAPIDPEIPREIRDDARDILDQLRQGADQFIQEQQ